MLIKPRYQTSSNWLHVWMVSREGKRLACKPCESINHVATPINITSFDLISTISILVCFCQKKLRHVLCTNLSFRSLERGAGWASALCVLGMRMSLGTADESCSSLSELKWNKWYSWGIWILLHVNNQEMQTSPKRLKGCFAHCWAFMLQVPETCAFSYITFLRTIFLFCSSLSPRNRWTNFI